jgi:sigma-B regulation protein RsbU (phosphoserine phosphatase)
MLSARTLSAFILELRQLEHLQTKSDSAFLSQGELILSAFLRNTPFEKGAVYLRPGRTGQYRLAAKSDSIVAPQQFEAEVAADLTQLLFGPDTERLAVARELEPRPQTLIPLRHTREGLGLVALSRDSSDPLGDDDVSLLNAASTYLGAVLTNVQMASEVREGDLELESLYDIGLSVASTLNLDRLSDEILVRTISLLNARRAALYLRKNGRFVLHQSFGDVRSRFLDEELTPDLAQKIADRSEAIVFDAKANCIFPDCESLIALPIRGQNGEVIGVLAAADRERREGGVGPFLESEVRLLSQFATQAAIALENARLHQEALEKQAMERELELAATIQKDILPRSLPSVEGFEVAALSRPARQLGGDYYAWFTQDGRLTVCVADVAGKSVPAAVLVSALHAALQLLVDEGRDLGEIATELNRHIHRWSSENKFITFIIATLDRESRSIRYVNAGHNPGYLIVGGEAEMLHSHGLPIGILPGTRYSAQTRRLAQDAVLVLYSDGITEAETLADEEFGNERLEAVLKHHGADSCEAISNAIATAVDEFTGDAAQKDDQTLVIVRAS